MKAARGWRQSTRAVGGGQRRAGLEAVDKGSWRWSKAFEGGAGLEAVKGGWRRSRASRRWSKVGRGWRQSKAGLEAVKGRDMTCVSANDQCRVSMNTDAFTAIEHEYEIE